MSYQKNVSVSTFLVFVYRPKRYAPGEGHLWLICHNLTPSPGVLVVANAYPSYMDIVDDAHIVLF